jgi:hypothetical protein
MRRMRDRIQPEREHETHEQCSRPTTHRSNVVKKAHGDTAGSAGKATNPAVGCKAL